MNWICSTCCFLLLLPALVTAALKENPPPIPAGEIVLREGLLLKGQGGRAGRNAFHVDPVEELIVKGQWVAPAAGTEVKGVNGTEQSWQPATATADGTFTNRALSGGYVYVPIVSERTEVKLLEAAGQSMVYVNGEPRVGDMYSNGILQLPVELHPGTNDFLFQVGRGRLKAKLVTPKAAVLLNLRDFTLPDLVVGDKAETWGAVVVVNSTAEFVGDLSLRATCDGGKAVETSLPSIPPMSVRKVGFRIRPTGTAPTNRVELGLELTRRVKRSGGRLDYATSSLRLRRPDQHYRQTFRSDIDGSIQYFAVVPAVPLPDHASARALFLSLHGASVEGMGQAEVYAPKSWGTVVAPTNRRPYGFDWEDWGRHDALEVLSLAQARFKTDPRQTYLTGHSMGGHGTWHLGATYPDRFAAIAPSAGWISFWSYGGAERKTNGNAVERLLQRATNPGDTLALASNYLHGGVYVLHGDADDNVPVTEARTMKEQLSRFHSDLAYHEQPGAGHWWGGCVDWPPIFDFFARHQIPADEGICDINYSTANPGVSSTSHWVTIEAQQRALAKSSVVIRYEPSARRFVGATENAARLALSLGQVRPGGAITVELDGQMFDKIPLPKDAPKLWFERTEGKWALSGPASLALKGPHRNGPFKEAFGNRMIFVYATKGTPPENKWAYAKARFDAETWWYRGNGAVDLLPDVMFNVRAEPDRGVVLYGNADNNAAWEALLSGSPVQVRREFVRIGQRELRGAELACLFCRPRPGSDRASVAVISGSGLTGLRLTERVPYFMAGIAYPDCTVFGTEVLEKASTGVLAAGFFGNDWGVESGEFAWRE